jgi:methylenetetrahydrofolate reductase (NADPH)
VDAINITDNQTSVCRMCSLAACIRLKTMGVEPVLQMVTRDRNRIALQSDLLGAASWDIHNMLCLSGDHQSFGDNAAGQNVHDLDSMQLLQTVRLMRDEGKFLGGDEIKRPPRRCSWARRPTPSPIPSISGWPAGQEGGGRGRVHPDPVHLQSSQIRKMDEGVVDRGLHEKVYIMAGITP